MISTVGPWREMDPKSLPSRKQRDDFGVIKGFYNFCEMGLEENVPVLEERTPEYIQDVQRDILEFLQLRASFLFQNQSVNVARMKVSTWHKCTKPSYIRKHGRPSDIAYLQEDARDRVRKRRKVVTEETDDEVVV